MTPAEFAAWAWDYLSPHVAALAGAMVAANVSGVIGKMSAIKVTIAAAISAEVFGKPSADLLHAHGYGLGLARDALTHPVMFLHGLAGPFLARLWGSAWGEIAVQVKRVIKAAGDRLVSILRGK